MATPLDRVLRVINTLKSKEHLFAENDNITQYAELGVTQAGIYLGKDWYVIDIEETTDVDENGDSVTTVTKFINDDLKQSEVYYCGLHAYRNYAMSQHDEYAKKAVNFKTINFAVSGLTERSKELMRIVWWCDTELERTLSNLQAPMGYSSMMLGVE